MRISPRKGTGIPNRPVPIAPTELAEKSLIPSHWPESLKCVVLVTALWTITMGIFFVMYVLG